MASFNPQAEELNKVILSANPVVYEMLSTRGKGIYFPKKGILVQGEEAKGKEINATIGIALEEDGSPMVLSTVADHLVGIKPTEAFPYAPSGGVHALRDKWKEMLYKKNESLTGINISRPVITNAITHGLSILGYLFVEEGDLLTHPDLFWGNYRLIFTQAYGAVINTFRFFNHDVFDLESFQASLQKGGIGKKILILNFPNNPAGYTPTIEAMHGIKKILLDAANAGNRLVVLLDDAYFGLVFEEGVYEESLFAELANLHENLLAVKLDGITKEDFAWGLRVGFITYGIKNGSDDLYRALEAKTSGAVRGNISNACHLSQSLVLKAFEAKNYDDEKRAKSALLKKRYLKVKEILAQHPEYNTFFQALPFNSGYFMCVKLHNLDAEKVRCLLLDKYSTGVISIENMLRIAFSSTPTDKLEKLFDNLYNACEEIAKAG